MYLPLRYLVSIFIGTFLTGIALGVRNASDTLRWMHTADGALSVAGQASFMVSILMVTAPLCAIWIKLVFSSPEKSRRIFRWN